MGPLSGIRIIDMTTVLMGPSATQMLGEMGADVLKVEAPEGDVTRQIGPARSRGMAALYLNANRCKRSISLDLKRPEAREALLELIAAADVLTFNVRPQAMKRLGLDRGAVHARNPKLIYASMVGFGQNGPYAGKPAYDDLIQGACGLAALSAQASDGTPRYTPSALADRVVGLAAVGGICAALFERERTGRGTMVEIPMFETMVAMTMSDHLAGQTFDPPLPGRGYARLLSRHRRPYATRDGYVCALVYTDRQWNSFLDQIGMEDLPERDPRFATFASRNAAIDDVYSFLTEVFATRTTDEWLMLLDAADVPAMPLHDPETLMMDRHLTATGFFRTVHHPTEGSIRTMAPMVRWPEQPQGPERPAPRQGADGVSILRELGWSNESIEALAQSGALVLPPDFSFRSEN